MRTRGIKHFDLDGHQISSGNESSNEESLTLIN